MLRSVSKQAGSERPFLNVGSYIFYGWLARLFRLRLHGMLFQPPPSA